MFKTYKYKLKPNNTQIKTFEKWLGTCRYLYNVALEHRISAYQSARVSVSRFDQYNQLVVAKNAEGLEWIKEVHSEVLQETLDRVDKSFQNFFKLNFGFPKWAKRDKYSSFTFKRSVSIEGKYVKLPKIGLVRFYNSRTFKGKIKYVTLVKELGSWYICFCVEQQPITRIENQGVGIDLGVVRLATLSNGDHYDNPMFFKHHARELRILQRKLARQKKGSNYREKTKQRIAKLWQKIRRKRTDYLHKVSTEICDNFTAIYLENLNLADMTKSAKGTIENPGKNVRAKSGLNRSLLDSNLHQFGSMLEYKTKFQSGTFVKVSPAYTSQTCSECGCVNKQNRISQSVFQCVDCSFTANADFNAAKNIQASGRSLSAQGGTLVRACA